jgi:hypothetical protein
MARWRSFKLTVLAAPLKRRAQVNPSPANLVGSFYRLTHITLTHITCNGDIPKTRINHSLTKGPDAPASMEACSGVLMYSRHPAGGTSRDEKGDWLQEAIIYNASKHIDGLSEAAEGRVAKVHPSIAQTTVL